MLCYININSSIKNFHRHPAVDLFGTKSNNSFGLCKNFEKRIEEMPLFLFDSPVLWHEQPNRNDNANKEYEFECAKCSMRCDEQECGESKYAQCRKIQRDVVLTSLISFFNIRKIVENSLKLKKKRIINYFCCAI